MKEIIETYQNNIRKIIRNITGQNNEDIEQEVYIKTWQNLDRYQETGKFKSWISTITANLCRDYLKSSAFKKNQALEYNENDLLNKKDAKSNVEYSLISRQRQKRIVEAIDSLKPKYKEVVILYEIKELPYEEISKIIKCPIGTVKSRLYNARKELSVILDDLIN